MVECVAKAIAASCEGQLSWERMPESYREGHRSSARAAIKEIRRAYRGNVDIPLDALVLPDESIAGAIDGKSITVREMKEMVRVGTLRVRVTRTIIPVDA